MMRLLGPFLYYLRWQRTMLWTTALGVLLAPLWLAVPPAAKLPVGIASAVFALGLPLSFAGIAFRQLISNRRCVLVPQLRSYAAAALLLLSLVSSLAVFALAGSAPGTAAADAIAPGTMMLLAFGLISAYVLTSQWLVTHSIGLAAFALLPLVILRLTIDDGVLVQALMYNPWLLTGAASAGWVWLFVAMRRPARHRRVAAPRWGSAMAGDAGSSQYWLPNVGRAASASGTLMRGVRDGLANRLSAVSLGLLSFPLTLLLVLWILGAPMGAAGANGLPLGLFMLFGLFGVAAYSSMAVREWPARLRCLWLRNAGDRCNAWRLLERHLARDLALLAMLSAGIALLLSAVTGADARYGIAFVIGCTGLTAMSSYFAFLSRASGWNVIADALLMILLMLLCMGSIRSLQSADTIAQLAWLIPVLAAATLVLRIFARRAMLRIDWSAVRPPRPSRAQEAQSA